MSPAESKRFVLVGLTVAALLTATDQVVKDQQVPHLRILIGAGMAAFLLTLLADAAPELAAGFAGTALVGALLLRGGVVSKLSNVVQGK